MSLPLGAIFFLFQRRLAETPEPRRLAPGPLSVSEQPSVSNRANLARPGSVNESTVFSIAWLMAPPDGFRRLRRQAGRERQPVVGIVLCFDASVWVNPHTLNGVSAWPCLPCPSAAAERVCSPERRD